MKKLLVTVVGAVAALGAFAALQSDTKLQFENAALGQKTIAELNTALGNYFSHGEGASNNTYTVNAANIGTCTVPSQIGEDPTTKALDIKTTFGNPLDVSVVAGGAAQDIDTGIYFDSLVKFTVCEDAPTQTYEGAKIVMWLQSEDGTGPTNLMVKAGSLSYELGVQVTAATYECALPTGFDADAFHRVTIKSIKNITTSTVTDVPGFAIYIDQATVGTSTAKWDTTFSAQYPISKVAAYLDKMAGDCFPSLVQSGSATQLTKAGFDGTGSITDIVFTSTAPDFAEDQELEEPVATVKIGDGEAEEVTSFADAVGKINNATSAAKLTLAKGLTLEEPMSFSANAEVTLDFAGFVLTNTSEFAAITNSALKLIVTDSAGTGGINCTSTGAAIYQTTATFPVDEETVNSELAITGGNFWGDDALPIDIDASYKGTLEIISGGAFAIPLSDCLVDGKVFAETAVDGLYAVIDKPVVNYTITFVYGMPAESHQQTVAENMQPTEPDGNAVAVTGWKFTGWDKEIVAATADVTYTAQYAQYVAQIVNGDSYTSLQAAVDAAQAGDTINVLADCTISTSLSIAKNLTIHNDHTITGAVNYAICIGATVSFEGSGKIERASKISGSAFCVGANETTRGAITAGTAGTLNFTGLTVCGGSGGNLIKLENGTVNMNGGVLKDGLRGIKADADAGNYTSAIVINGGTITNCTGCAVMASAESATGTATVTISGGVICGVLDNNEGGEKQKGIHTITIPATSTAKFDRDQTAFCASGYATALSDGWYVVGLATYTITYKTADGAAFTAWAENYTAPASFTIEADATLPVAANIALTGVQFNGWTNATGTAVLTTAGLTANLEVFANTTVLAPVVPEIDPSASKVEVTVAAESDTAAIEAVTVTPPANSGADAADYKALFNFTATAGATAGEYTVTLTGIKEEVTTTVSTDAVKLLDGTGDGKVAVPAGLYYKVTPSTALPISGDAQTGVSDGTGVEVTKPGTTQGFIEVKLSPTPFAN